MQAEELPEPGRAGSLDKLVARLRRLKVWAGDPSYEAIKERVNAGRPPTESVAKNTVADCFRPGRQRLNIELVLGVVEALHPDPAYVARWRHALRVVVDGESAARQVRVRDDLPHDLPGFTGRADEVGRIRAAGRTVVISGMAGVGKSRLAVHAGHLLLAERGFDRVFFVNLRGFHADPAEPPAHPAAVLDALLRLLDVPVQRLAHRLATRVAAYRERLAGVRALVVLDNAADEEQVRPLLAHGPGCLTVVTSRRELAGLADATPVPLDVFAPEQAEEFLAQAVQVKREGPDAPALRRIARRCGYLPLALGVVAGHIGGLPGWTLTDHADRLDQRHADRRLDTGVTLALDVSYRHLPAPEQRLLRLLALHPGPDFDAYAAAALGETGLPEANRRLDRLCADSLVQRLAADRYTFHDLVRAWAAVRAGDDESPSAQRAALTRLFDHYLGTAALAMETLAPAESAMRPQVPRPRSPVPAVGGHDEARAWLAAEHHTFVAMSLHTAAHGWHSHAVQLASTLFRYLNGHTADALIIHTQAGAAAERAGEPIWHAHALTNVGTSYGQAGRSLEAGAHYERALRLFRQHDDLPGQIRVLSNQAVIQISLGRYRRATEDLEQSLELCRQTGDQPVEARILSNLGWVDMRVGRYPLAEEHLRQSIALSERIGYQYVGARALSTLGAVELRLGRVEAAGAHLDQALLLFRKLGDRTGEGWAIDRLASLRLRLGRPAEAAGLYREALEIFRDVADREGEARATIGLGYAADTPAEALSHHQLAHAIATETGDRYREATAEAGLGDAYRALGEEEQAGRHFRRAWSLFQELGVPEADAIRERLEIPRS